MSPRLSDLGKVSVYYTIAFLLCAGAAFFSPQLGERTTLLAMFAPSASVFLMLFVITHDGYTRAGLCSLGIHKAGWSGWPLAIAIPPVVLSFAYSAVWLTGAASVRVPNIQAMPYALDLVASIAVVTLSTGIGEELGWRGYLLPRLASLGVTRALLLSGFLHGMYHLPVMLGTPYYHASGNQWLVVPLFLLTLTAAGVCYGYLRLTTGSIWPAALAHAVFNIAWDRLNALSVTDSPVALEYLAGESGLLTLLALASVAALLLRRLASRPLA